MMDAQKYFLKNGTEVVVSIHSAEDTDEVIALLRKNNQRKHFIASRRHIIHSAIGLEQFYVARIDNRLIGCVAMSSYGDNVFIFSSWLVDEDFRRRGIGKILFDHCFNRRNTDSTIFVMTSVTGIDRYKQLQFKEAYYSVDYTGVWNYSSMRVEEPTTQLFCKPFDRELNESEVIEYDKCFHSVDRSRYLKEIIRRGFIIAGVCVFDSCNKIRGYAFAQPQSSDGQLSNTNSSANEATVCLLPAYCDDPDFLCYLMFALLKLTAETIGTSTLDVFIRIPEHSNRVRERLEGWKFEHSSRCVYMVQGEETFTAKLDRVLAMDIASISPL